MFGILLFYFIGKRFYDLSETYEQNKWLFAILSIVVYLAAGFMFGLILGLLSIYFSWEIDWDHSLGINLLGIPIGLLGVWIFYSILEKRWKKTIVQVKDEIHDIGRYTED